MSSARDNIMEDKKVKSVLSLASLGIAAVLVTVLAVKLVGQCIADDGLLDSAGTKSAETGGKLTKNQEIAKALRAKNMFTPPKPKPKPPGQVQAIFGSRAMINNKWYGVGDTIPPGAKLISVEATLIKIEWEGKEKILAPISAATVPSPKKSPEKPKKPDKAPVERPKVVQQASQEAPPKAAEPVEEDIWAWLDVPDEVKRKLKEKYEELPPETRKEAMAKFKEHWAKMSDEQKKAFIKMILSM